MANNTPPGRVEITGSIEASLKNAIASMGDSIQYVLRITNDLNRTSMSTKSGVDSLNKALSSGTSASSAYSRATSNLSKNQQVLANHFKKVSETVDRLERDIQRLNRSSTANASASKQQASASQALVNSLKGQLAMQKQIQKYSLAQSYKNQAASLTDLSNKYSMSGTRMSLSVSAPIVAFARSAFSTFKRLEVQTVRTTKLIGDSYKSIDEVVKTTGARLAQDGKSYTMVMDGQVKQLYTVNGAMEQLGKTLDSITYKYGISRELVQGLVGDYAELGISSIDALGSLVDLTAATEKLGNVDIGESQAFIQSIYQTVMRVNRDLGNNVSPEDALKEVTGQLAMFNLIENKTSLSLNNLAKGFPELTASATSFGLSMGEATALMVPMVAAGFQVGASANSVKVSLQRLVDLTKENSQLIDGFRQNNKAFTIEAGVGIQTIQKLADSYNFLKESKGEQGTMEMFSNLFGVRQGPRMEVAIQNLAQFQDALDRQDSIEREIADKFEEYIQKNTAGLGDKYSKFQVKKFEDLSTAVELASSKDKATAKAFTKGRQEFAEYIKSQAMAGADVISQISTEAGRALFVAAQGGSENSEAYRKFLQEVEASLDTAETRYNRAREIIKGIGRQIVPILGELLKVIVPVLDFVQNILKKIGPVGKVIIAIGLGLLAAIGPIMKVMGAVFQMRSAFASIRGMNAFGRLKSQAIEVSESMIRSNQALFKMRGGLAQFGNKFFLKATLKEFKQLEKAMQLEQGGFLARRKANKIYETLGVDKRKANFEGLAPGYKESIQAGFNNAGDLSVGQGYMKEVYDSQGNAFTQIKTEAAAIGTGIAEAFLEVLNMNGFDTNQVAPPRAPKPPKGGGPGPVQGPPSPPGAGPNSGYPGPGGGSGGGSGGSGGSGGKPSRRVSGNKNYQQMIDDITSEVNQGANADLDNIAQNFDKLVNGIDKFTEDIAEKALNLSISLQTATQDWDPDNLKILLNNSLQDMENLFTQRLDDLRGNVTIPPVNPSQPAPAPTTATNNANNAASNLVNNAVNNQIESLQELMQQSSIVQSQGLDIAGIADLAKMIQEDLVDGTDKYLQELKDEFGGILTRIQAEIEVSSLERDVQPLLEDVALVKILLQEFGIDIVGAMKNITDSIRAAVNAPGDVIDELINKSRQKPIVEDNPSKDVGEVVSELVNQTVDKKIERLKELMKESALVQQEAYSVEELMTMAHNIRESFENHFEEMLKDLKENIESRLPVIESLNDLTGDVTLVKIFLEEFGINLHEYFSKLNRALYPATNFIDPNDGFDEIVAEIGGIVAEPDKPAKPVKSETDKLADAVKKIEENAQKIFDVAMNPTIEGLESLKRYQLEMIAKLYGLQIGKRSDTNLRQNIMNAVENSVKIDTTLEDIKEKLTKRAGSANGTRGSPKVEDAVDEVTDVVATTTQETLADVIHQQGEETKETVKKSGSRSGKGGGTKKTQEASEETSEKVQNATEDKLEEVITNTGEKVVNDIQKDSKNTTATIKPKAINLSEIRSGILSIYNAVLPKIAENEKNFDPNKFLEDITYNLDIASLNDEQIIAQLDTFVQDILTTIDKNKRDLANAQKQAYALIEEAAIENYTLLIQQAQSGLFKKEKGVDYFDAKALRGVVKQLQGFTEKQAGQITSGMRVLLETIQKGEFDASTFDDFRQRLLKLKIDIGSDLGEFVELLIAGMQQKLSNASSEDKPGFSSFINGLKKLQSSMGELSKSVETSIEIEGQVVEGLAIRAKTEASKSMAIRNRISPTVVGRTTYAFGDESDVDNSRTGGVGGYNVEGADGAGLSGTLDAILTGKDEQSRILLGISESNTANRDEINQEIQDLQEQIDADNKLLEEVKNAVSKISPGPKKQIKEKEISELKKLISEREDKIQSLQEKLQSDEVTVSTVEESVLEKVKRRRKRIDALTKQIEELTNEFDVQKAKIEAKQKASDEVIPLIFQEKKNELLEKIEKAQKYSEENAQAIADTVDRLNNERNNLQKMMNNYVERFLDEAKLTEIAAKQGEVDRASQAVRMSPMGSESYHAAYARFIELSAERDKLKSELSGKLEPIRNQEKLIADLKAELSDMQSQATAPKMSSDETLMRDAADQFQAELDGEKKLLAGIRNRRTNFYAELNAEHINYAQMVEQLRRTMIGGIDSVMGAVADLATPEGFAELVAQQKEEQELRIAIIREQDRLQRNRLKILAGLMNFDSSEMKFLSYESLLEEAIVVRKRLNAQIRQLNSISSKIAKTKGKIKETTDPAELAKLKESLDEAYRIRTVVQDRIAELSSGLSVYDAKSLEDFGKTIFSDQSKQQVIGFTDDGINDKINNELLAIQKNSELEIQEKLDKFKDDQLTGLRELKELGFKSTDIGLRELSGDQLRLTSAVLENLSKEFGIVVPEIWMKIGELADKTNLKFKDQLAAKKFVLSLLSKVKPTKAEGAKSYVADLAIFDEILEIDSMATKLTMGIGNIGIDKLGFLKSSSKVVADELKNIAGFLGRKTDSPDQAIPVQTEEDIAKIKEEFSRINSADEQIDGFLTLFEEERRRHYLMIASVVEREGDRAAARRNLTANLESINFLKMQPVLSTAEEVILSQLEAEVIKLKKYINDEDKIIKDLNKNIKEAEEGRANTIRNRIRRTQLRSKKRVDAVKGAGQQFFDNKPPQTGVLDTTQLTRTELEERKAPNPFLLVRPEVIPEKVSVARKEIISLTKALQVADAEQIPVLLSKIKQLKVEIDKFQDAKHKSLYMLVEGFLKSVEGLTSSSENLTRSGRQRVEIAEKIRASISDAIEEGNRLGLDASEIAERTASVMVASAREVKGFHETQLRRSLDVVELDRSLELSMNSEDEFDAMPRYRNLNDLKKRPRSLSAASYNPLDDTIIQELGIKIFKQIGLVGEDAQDAILSYLNTLIMSREKLQNVARSPVADMQNMLASLQEALATIGLTLEEAIADPIAAIGLMGDRTKNEFGKAKNAAFEKAAKGNEFIDMFRTLSLFARDIAKLTAEQVEDAIQEAEKATIARLSGARRSSVDAGNTPETKPVVAPAVDTGTRRGLFPKELGTKEGLKAAVQALVEEIKQVGFSEELFLQATTRELQLIASYLLADVKDFDENGKKTKVASRTATNSIDKATAVIQKYFGNIVESADYVALQTGFVAPPVVEKPKEAKPAENKVTKAAKELDNACKKLTDDFVNDLNMLTSSVSQMTSGQIPMLEVPVIEEKITQVSNDISEYLTNIAHLILEAINMPYDELVDLLNHLQSMPTDIRDQLSAATKLPFETMFEHIESLIIESVTEMADDAYDAILPVVNNTPAPSATLARTVAESIDYINQELSSFPQVKNYANIEDELQLLINKISTITEDELLSLQLALEKIMVDPSEIQNWTRIMGSNIQDIYDTISDQIKKLQTVVQNTTPPVTPATPAPTPTTGGGSGSGGRKPPATPTPPSGGQYGPPTPANYNYIAGKALPTSSALKNMGYALKDLAKETWKTAKDIATWLLPQIIDLGMAAINAVARIIPFGRSILKLASIPLSAASGMFKLASAIREAHKQATGGLNGIDKFKAGIKSLGETLKTQGLSLLKSGASKFIPGIPGKSGRSGSGRGLGGMLTSQVGMSAGMLGTGPLGMMGGNMLQGLIQSLSAIPVIGTPVVLILSTIAGVIGVLTKSSKAWGSTNKITFENFRNAWKEIKVILGMLIAPFEDFIGTIIGGTGRAKTGTDKAKDALQSFSEWFLKSMTKLKGFVEKTVVPALRKLLEVIIILYNNIKPVVGSLFAWISAKVNEHNKKNKLKVDVETTNTTTNATKNNAPRQARNATANEDKNMENQKQVDDAKAASAQVQKTWTALKENLNKLTKTFGILVKGFLMSMIWNILAWIDMAAVNGVEQLVILVINAFRLMFKLINNIMGMAVKGIITLFFMAVKGIVGSLTMIPKAIASGLGFFSRWIPGFKAAAGAINGVVDGIYSSLDTAQNAAVGGVDTAVNFVNSNFDKLADSINKKIGSWSNVIAKSNNQVQDRLKKETGAEIKALFAGVMPEGSGKGLFKSFKDLITQAFKNPETAKAAGEALKDALAAVKDAKIKATIEFNNSALDAVSGKLGQAVNKIKDELTEQLTAQKDASLKVFDDQIEAINALADAEAQLTATEQYESNRRKAIRDNELRRQNNRKDRSLAIYEGRIDDARSLDLQEIKDSQDFNDQITEMDSGRQKDLQSINRNNAIEIIKAQREAASKQFDQAIKDFEKYSEKLLENGTFTEEQFKDQVTKMLTQAGLTSTGIQTKFTELFSALPAKIQTGMDPITAQAGFFSTGLESLRTTAATKFGLATGVSDPNSILGITTGMLGGIGSSVSTAFAVGGPIQTSYGTGLDAVNAYVKAKTTGEGPETTSSIFKQAIVDAAQKMVDEANSKKPEVAAAAAKLVTGINDELKKIQKDSLAKAIAEAGANGVAAMKKSIADAKAAADTASQTGQNDSNSNTWWYRVKGTGLKGWVAVPAGSVDQYIGNSKYDFTGTQNGARPTFFKGGMMPYAKGGPTFGSMNAGIPATLHGGEFVIRKSAVDKYGLDMLSQINKGMYAPKVPSLNIPMASYSKIANAGSSQQISTSESNHNYNFYVDNFIGETEWFNTMMKEYNVKVVPANQKQAGLESRVVKSYNGINRGL